MEEKGRPKDSARFKEEEEGDARVKEEGDALRLDTILSTLFCGVDGANIKADDEDDENEEDMEETEASISSL